MKTSESFNNSVALQSYLKMFLIREAELRIGSEFRKKTFQTPIHLAIGQEAISVGVSNCLLSTDAETLLMYSDKYLLEGSLTTATSKVILNGDTVFMPDDLSDHGLRAWFASKKIVKTVYFLIGIDAGTRVVLLAVNYNTLLQSNDAEYFSLLTSAKKIKKIIERSKGIKKLLS
jgi:hypothetical protein